MFSPAVTSLRQFNIQQQTPMRQQGLAVTLKTLPHLI
jgi:hypothetical protein